MSELVPYQPRAELATFTANDTDSWTTVLTEVATLASRICDTPFVPDGLRGSAPAVAAAILSGRELGLGPMTSLANIHVIKGKPALSAALMRALILAQGHQIETIEVNDTRAKVRGRRRGESEWETAEFNADQAKRAGIVLGGYPQDKLYARATSRLARRKFADVIAGMPYSAEELEDGPAVDTATGEITAGPAAAESTPRTAQRQRRTTSPPPAAAVTPSAAAPSNPPAQAAAGGDLPPLPGEDEPADRPTGAAPAAASAGDSASRAPAPGQTAQPDDTDYDTPGTVTNRQLTAIWTSLSQTYHFGPDEKDQARGVCAQIVKRELASSKDLSFKEAKVVLNTLALWRDQAVKQDEPPRGYLLAMLNLLREGEGVIAGPEGGTGE